MKGGEEKIEEVRVGLLGFKRDVEGLRSMVDAKKREVEGLVAERKAVREEIHLGRTLLDIDQRLEELEDRLMIKPNGAALESDDAYGSGGPSDSEDDSEDEQTGGVPTRRLQSHAQQYLYIEKSVERVGSNHPFLSQQKGRLVRLKDTVLLDLGNALKQSMGSKDQDRTLKILGIYRLMDQANEATRALKDIRP